MRLPSSLSDARLAVASRRLAALAAAIAALAALLVLAGWAFNIDVFKSMLPGQISMKPLTAFGLLLTGAALWLLSRPSTGWQRRLALILAGVVAAVGGLVVLEYWPGVDLDIDQALFRGALLAENAAPIGRPAPATAVCFLLLGLALLMLDARPAWLAPLAALLALGIGGLAALGYAYEVGSLYQIGPYIPIAPHTALVIVVLALGLLAARPESPIIGVLSTRLAGSSLSRPLLPIVFLVPFGLGWLDLWGQRLGLYDTGFGVGLLVTGNVVVFAALIYASARLLNQADARRESAFRALQEREERLRVLADATPNGLLIVAETGVITWANQRAEALFGQAAGELLGRRIDELVPDRFQGVHAAHRVGFAADPRVRLMGSGRHLFARRRDGSQFPVEIGLSPIETSQGNLTLASVVDITERQRAESALRQSEERFAKAFRASPAALTVTRLTDGRFVDVNDQFLHMFGYERDEVIGHTSLELHLFAEPAARVEPVRQLLADGAVRNAEMPLMTKTGEQRRVLFSTEQIELGGEAHALAILIDNTERHRAEEAARQLNAGLEARVQARTAELAANEAKLSALFEVLPVGVSILDTQRRVVNSNAALARIMRLSREGLAAGAYNRRQFIRPDGSSMPPEEYASTRALGEQRPVLNVETGIITETGETLWTDVSAAPLPVAGLGVVVVTTDITERKQIEQALAAQAKALATERDQLQALMDNVPDTIYFKDTASRFTRINAAQARFLGVANPADAIGKTDFDYQAPEPARAFYEEEQQLLRSGQPLVGRIEFNPAADGQPRWLSATKVPLKDAAGRVIGLVGVSRDVTERALAEAALTEGERRYRTLFEEVRRQAQELTLRDRMHQALARDLDLAEILRLLVEGIAETLGYALVSLYLLEGQRLRLQHQVGYHQVLEYIPITAGVSGRVARTGQPVLLEDVHTDPTFLGAIEGITSEICVPLYYSGEVAGVLNVESTQAVKLTDADLRLMLALGEQASFALGRARLAAQARESQQRFAGAFNYATIGMALVAPDGRWLQVNPAICQLVGYSEAELLATNFQTITHPDDLEKDLGLMRQVLAGKLNTYQLEKRYLHKSGRVLWILLSVSLVRDPAGRPLYFISQINDITERKQAEQELAAQTRMLAHERDLMQALMDSVPDTIYFKDAASRFTRINRAQAQYLGLPSPEAALGKTDLDFQETTLAREIYDEEQRLVMQGRPLLNRIDFVHAADGHPRWISSTKVPLMENGQVVGLVGISRDISAVKEAEARLLASLQEKEVLLKEIHHRVKNNLQIVSSLLHLQAESVGDPRLREAFDDSQRRVRSMALLHEQLYRSPDLARIDFGQYVSGLVTYLRRSQARSGGLLQMRVEIENITLEIDQAIPLGLMVNEIVTNSLKYAFPARPGAGQMANAIWVAATRDPAGSLTLVVGDTGVGLPAAVDLDNPVTMGSQLIRSFATQLRGQLSVRRQPGTVYTLTIPERALRHG